MFQRQVLSFEHEGEPAVLFGLENAGCWWGFQRGGTVSEGFERGEAILPDWEGPENYDVKGTRGIVNIFHVSLLGAPLCSIYLIEAVLIMYIKTY